MERIACADDVSSIKDNFFIGSVPVLERSSIVFNGTGNVFYCEEGVRIYNSKICFNGSNSVVSLGRSRHKYYLDVAVYNSSVLAIGRDCYMNGTLHAIASERRNIIIGNDCLISFGVWIRTADPHLIYDVTSSKRINASKDVLIGDHAWLGQSCFLLKGTLVGSGSIIGGAAVVAGKALPSNTSWAGNPAKQLRGGVMWDGRCVHAYSVDDSRAVDLCETRDYLFDNGVPPSKARILKLSEACESASDAFAKYDELVSCFYNLVDHDRFSILSSNKRRDSSFPLSAIRGIKSFFIR